MYVPSSSPESLTDVGAPSCAQERSRPLPERDQIVPERDQAAAEQQHVNHAYTVLEAELDRLGGQEGAALSRDADDPTALTERDAEVRRLSARRSALLHAEPKLCFGRLDRTDGRRLHIGPAGLRDGDRRLSIDWRAPAAEPFYAATAREPLGLTRRRHITLESRRVVRVDDDVFDPEILDGKGPAGAAGADGSAGAEGPAGADGLASDVVGEGALLRALSSSRDGRMHEAVATLQAEQDAIVRAPKPGVLVVQGAPGTGKTVVAVHRAAYLLYRYPEVLRRGVLIIGPNRRFLDYIGDVLPALGETNVVTATVETLLPGLEPSAVAPPELARLLGDERLAETLRLHLSDLQGAVGPRGHAVTWDGDQVVIDCETIARCADRAQKLERHHNLAREIFLELILDELAERVTDLDAAMLRDVEAGFEEEVRRVDAALARSSDALMPAQEGRDVDAEEALARDQLRAELAADADVGRELDALWPHLTPEQAVRSLLAGGLTAPHLDEQDRELLAASADDGWTDAHVALLDEAAELLGQDESAQLRAAERAEERQLAHAQRVIASTPGLAGRISAQDLAAQNTVADSRDLATRALADRSWVYGHVIVDEAQELTPMQWRMLARRCPTRSMTVVGDIAQTSAPLATTTWEGRLTALATTPHQEELTICYRSPRELVQAVEPMLRRLRPDARAIDAVRRGHRPVLADGDVDEQITAWARAERTGQRAIITPRPQTVLAELRARGLTASADDLREALMVLPPVATKGLEFDHVLVHDAHRIEAEHGAATLYVALTRATVTLAVALQEPTDLGPVWERRPLG